MKNLIFTTLIALLALLSRSAHAQSPQPISDRLDAIVAYPLVISLRVPDENALRRGVTTRIDDGRTFTSTPYWVGRIPYLSLPSWITSYGQWEAMPYEQARRTPPEQRPSGSWFIVVPLPIDAVGQGLWFDQTRYELNWLPDPERSLLEADTVEHTRDFASFWSMHLDEQTRDDPSVTNAIAQLRRDPFQHWRARLLTDGLDPDRTRARETLANTPDALRSIELELSTQSPGIDLLNAIARQQEARWQIILGRIWLIDPETAERLKQTLMRTARFYDRTLPIWSDNQSDLAQLSHDLLSPFVNDDTRVLRAKAWLETQPRSIAWVIDDQGSIEANTERLLPTLGVISMPSEPGSSAAACRGRATLTAARDRPAQHPARGERSHRAAADHHGLAAALHAADPPAHGALVAGDGCARLARARQAALRPHRPAARRLDDERVDKQPPARSLGTLARSHMPGHALAGRAAGPRQPEHRLAALPRMRRNRSDGTGRRADRMGRPAHVSHRRMAHHPRRPRRNRRRHRLRHRPSAKRRNPHPLGSLGCPDRPARCGLR
ncbi:MAG: hypothetical protein R3B67_11335 [Phycisphaerales bacterium]